MKDNNAQNLRGIASEDSDTKILKSEDTVVDEPTVVLDELSEHNKNTVKDNVAPHLEGIPPYRPAKPEQSAKKSKTWIAWVVGIVVLCGAGVGAWCLFGGDSANDANAQADHSDDDEFANFGRMIRAVEENPSLNGSEYEEVYATDPEYYPVEAPAVEEPYDYYAPEAEAAPAPVDSLAW